MSFWNLPPAPPTPPSMEEVMRTVMELSRDFQHEQLEAVEQLCYYAQRDGHSVFVAHARGVVQDAYVSKYGPAGNIYYADVSRLSFYT